MSTAKRVVTNTPRPHAPTVTRWAVSGRSVTGRVAGKPSKAAAAKRRAANEAIVLEARALLAELAADRERLPDGI
ncbi:hypothetical protein BCF74_10973 [Knoellia remsis]|uniref:Uncharacterized protein n=1 Tax=Knoellia remsis TaxID=407159 RepID=A0A2T0UNI0_9MICO|nr:hypothetical protein BCF74_10973 [Knoellia remsis]